MEFLPDTCRQLLEAKSVDSSSRGPLMMMMMIVAQHGTAARLSERDETLETEHIARKGLVN